MEAITIPNTATPHKVLRLIVTNRCNYHCIYCHHEGMNDSTEDLLKISDYIFLIELAREFFENIAVAGGEPLLYENIIKIAEAVRYYFGQGVYLTTNGSIPLTNVINNIHLFERINISINSLIPNTFRRITGNDISQTLFDNVENLLGLNVEVHINTVLIPGINDLNEEIQKLLDYSRNKGLPIEFLHLMARSPVEKSVSCSAIIKFRNYMEILGYSSNFRYRPFSHPNTLYYKNAHKVIFRDYAQIIDSDSCSNCSMKAICTEGMCHIRLLPNGLLTACMHGLQMDILKFIKVRDSKKIIDAIVTLQKLYDRPIHWKKLCVS